MIVILSCSDSSTDPADNNQENTVTDYDGNVYKTVTIGTQVWMAENLKTTKYNDGLEINLITNAGEWSADTSGAYCNYNNSETNAAIYGLLYNWYAVNSGKLAPEGWHVPTDDDWTILEDYLITNGYNFDGTTTENKIAKSLASDSGWNNSDTTGSVGNTDFPEYRNKTGFSLLPAGYRGYNGIDFEMGNYTRLWTSSSSEIMFTAWIRELSFKSVSVERKIALYAYGFSVRCVKD
ncbi:MAG: fibrobacter succinogenes major paralogous domain-containing protein [Calditrichaceae bacterium]|nr:fibrobacter succinogenes major paralogous domain-containing protein [Calditrichaceae bacterium]MBN2708955.1 fibrobacter succinogenes major paralogous domain-containing protein [Calditrichaceae bacterium]